jgi:hypothetical protein
MRLNRRASCSLGLIAIAAAVAISGCDGTGDTDSADIQFHSELSTSALFSGHLNDVPDGTVHVTHPGGGQVVEIGRSSGRFQMSAGHVSAPLSTVPSEFTRGRYRDKFTMDRLGSDLVEHYHEVALLKFSAAGAGTACILLNGTLNLSTAKVLTSFSVLGGTGEGGKVRMSGTATAGIGSSSVELSGRGKLSLGSERSAPAECRDL